jgi:hypothetical protein
MNYRNALVFAGVGAFIGFMIAVLSYAPLEDYRFAYMIYGGAIIGAMFGGRSEREFPSAFTAFLLGLLVTAMLGVVWGETGVTEWLWKLGLAVVMAVMLLVKPSGLLDVILSPVDYVGGFAIALLTLRFYGPIQGVENGITAIVVFSGSALTFAFMASLARYGFETFRNLKKGNA